MRRRSRHQGMLQQYELEPRTSLRLPARSEAHELAHVRMRREDVHALRRPAGEMCAPIVALFSTRDAHETVRLRPSETLYVQLPERDVDPQQEAGAAESVAAVRRAADRRAADRRAADRRFPDRRPPADPHAVATRGADSAERDSAERDAAELDAAEPDAAEPDAAEHHSAQRNGRRNTAAWTPLRVVAHHSYVAGMRVSGIVHRAIVRLEFDRK
jgi:hypothetical protein